MSKDALSSDSGEARVDQDRSEDLSFAVELKFLVRQSRDDLKDPKVRPFVPHLPVEFRNSMTESEIQLWQGQWEAIARTLNTIPNVDALTGHQIQEKGLGRADYWKTHWIIYKSNSAVPSYVMYDNDDPDRPLLDPAHPDSTKYAWIPAEICSPLLRWFTIEKDPLGEDGDGNVLKAVLETVNSGKCGAVFANHSTETHVHMGRLDGRPLLLGTFKRLATLAWLSEPILRGVKDPKSPNFEHVYTWSSPLRRHSRLGMALQDQAGELIDSDDSEDFRGFIAGVDEALAASNVTTILGSGDVDTRTADHLDSREVHALRSIWRAHSHQQLGRLLSGSERKYRRLGFNFHSLEQSEEGPGVASSPQTVEFRFLEGFLETGIVYAWVRLCGEMVALATESVETGRFYAVAAICVLLTQRGELALEAKFCALMETFGEDRIPKSVWKPLQEVIGNNFPHNNAEEQPIHK